MKHRAWGYGPPGATGADTQQPECFDLHVLKRSVRVGRVGIAASACRVYGWLAADQQHVNLRNEAVSASHVGGFGRGRVAAVAPTAAEVFLGP